MAYISCKETARNLLFRFHEKWHAHVRDMISKGLSLRGEWGEGYLSEVYKDTSKHTRISLCQCIYTHQLQK